MYEPLLTNNQPAFGRRLVVDIWHIRRLDRTSPFVVAGRRRQKNNWLALRLVEWTHDLNRIIAVVIGHVHQLVAFVRFMQS